ncbi:MAG: tRNA glutamyl-Q(34) synthetase GluQRS [Acidimicrobiales bacterium]
MPTGRYAPSPTGTFHLGNLRTAVAAWLFARASQSDFLLRWEDLDLTADPRHESSQLADLAALGVTFDGTPLRQSDRTDAYAEVIADLTRRSSTYRCWCSRREIQEATRAPHGVPGSYPGTCRHLSAREIAVHERSGREPALRLRTDSAEVEIVDSLHGRVRRAMDDIVLRRGDGTPAYNLVVVVDDEHQGVGQVVRGDDLLDSTPRHAYLQRLLGYREPVWTHVPLVVDTSGERLAKRDGSAGLASWHDAGGSNGGLIAAFATTLGIPTSASGEPPTLGDLVTVFDADRIPLSPAAYDGGGPRLSLAD